MGGFISLLVYWYKASRRITSVIMMAVAEAMIIVTLTKEVKKKKITIIF